MRRSDSSVSFSMILDSSGFFDQCFLDLGHGIRFLSDLVHPLKGPEEVDRRGAGGGNLIGNGFQLLKEFLLGIGLDGHGAQRQPIGCCHTDGRGPSDAQSLDGVTHLSVVGDIQKGHFQWKQCLV